MWIIKGALAGTALFIGLPALLIGFLVWTSDENSDQCVRCGREKKKGVRFCSRCSM